MRRDAIFRRSLLIADVVSIVGALGLIVAVSPRSVQIVAMCCVCLPVLLVGAKLYGLYDRDEALMRKTTLDEAPKLFQLATMCALLVWIASGTVLPGTMGALRALALWLSLTVFLVSARAVARKVARNLTAVERCLFIGDVATAKTMRSKLVERGGIRAEMVAHVDLDDSKQWLADEFCEDRLTEIANLAMKLDVHRAIVAPRSADAGETLDLMRTLKAVGVRVSVLPRLLEVVGSSVEFDDLHGVTVMGVRRFDLTRSSAALKRTFDLVSASIMLAAAAPLMLAFAVLIKLDSKGPVIFRQQRVGRYGRRFYIFKFRTMVADAEAVKDSLREHSDVDDGLFKLANDPRVTRVGKLLRKTALDELPQLVNILRGEMSMVGPRPLVVDEDSQVQGWDRRRLELTPGMTGHWQILGHGALRVPLSEMVAIDYLYVANWSLWNDIKILLRTVPHVLARRGV